MVKKILGLIIWVSLFHALMGCGDNGQNGNSLTSTDDRLNGQWIASRSNAHGDQILLTLTPGTGERQVIVSAIRPQGDRVDITRGNYALDGNHIAFQFTSRIPSYTAAFTITPSDLTLGTDLYHKVTSTDGPQVGGQIQVPQSAMDESVQVSTLALSQSLHFVPGEVLIRSRSSSSAAALSVSGHPSPRSSYQKMVISLPEGSTALTASGSHSGISSEAFKYLEDKDRLRTATLEKIEELRRQGVQAIPNMILHTQSLAEPTDPLFSDQWNLRILNITDAWELAHPQRDVVVAVIDTGIVRHPDLDDHLLLGQGYDFVMNSLSLDGGGPDTDPTDPGDRLNNGLGSWHGTHIAGIIAASVDNGVGIAGMAGVTSHVKILPLRAMGLNGDGTLYDVSQAILYAAKLPNVADCDFTSGDVDNQTHYTVDATHCRFDNPRYTGRSKADIINLSLGAAMQAPQAGPLNDAIDAAVAAGVLVITAAGNESKGPGWCFSDRTHSFVRDDTCNFYPAANPHVLSIGAIYPNLAFASDYSNFGSTSNNTQFLVAPGGSRIDKITSTISPSVSGGYGDLNGTSQAAAHVSGVAALVMADNPTISADQVREALRTSAFDLGDSGRDIYYGFGLLNPCGALLAARGTPSTGTGILHLSSTSVDFGSLGNAHTVIVTSGCGNASLSGISFSTTTSDGGHWLNATLSGTETPAQLSLGINRSGLGRGDYTGTITLNSPAGNSTIHIAMTVGEATPSRTGTVDNLSRSVEDFLSDRPGFDNVIDVGEMQIVLVNADDLDHHVAAPRGYGTVTDFRANYNFHLFGILPGRYYLYAGVDRNRNGTICDPQQDRGEPCLIYPTNTNQTAIEVSSTTRKNNLVLTY